MGAQRTTLERESLNEQVYTLLRQRLLERQHDIREKLSLQEIADEMGVSRSPIHYALTRLVAEGLLIVKPRRGYYVAPLTLTDVENAYSVRLALELLAAEESLPTVSNEQLSELRRLMQAVRPPEGGFADTNDFYAANQALHEFQIDLAGNTLMSSIYRGLCVNLMMARLLAGRPLTLQQVLDDHVELVEAFESRSLTRVQGAIRRHIETGQLVASKALFDAGGSV